MCLEPCRRLSRVPRLLHRSAAALLLIGTRRAGADRVGAVGGFAAAATVRAVSAESGATRRSPDRLGIFRVDVHAEGHRSPIVGDHHYRRRDSGVGSPHAGRRPEDRPWVLRHLRPELQLPRGPRVLTPRGLQRACPPAGGRAQAERQRLRKRPYWHRISLGRGSDRTHRDYPRTELGALWNERVLRGHQRHHETGQHSRRDSRHRQRSGASTRIEGRATYSRRFSAGPELLVSATGSHIDGQQALFFPEFDDPATNNGIAERADSDQFTKLFARVSAGNLTLQALYGTRDKTIPTASFGTVFDDPRSRTIETLGFLDMQYTRKLRAQWELASRLSYDRYGYDGDYVYGSEEESAASRVINKDFARGNSWGAEIKASRRVARIQRVALGAEYRNNFRQDQYNYDLQPFFQYLDDRRNSQNWASVRAGRDRPPSEASPEPGRPPRSLRQLRRNDQPETGADLLPAKIDDAQGALWRSVPRTQCVRVVLVAERRSQSEPALATGDESNRGSRRRALSQ